MKLICPICKGEFNKIDKQHLFKKHNLSIEQYRSQYPLGPLGASDELKAKLGARIKARGPRSAETRAKISTALTGKPQVQTLARIAAIPARVEAARIANTGAKRPKTTVHAKKISEALLSLFATTPKPKYDKSSERYQKQLLQIEKLRQVRREEGESKFAAKLSILKEWASINEEIKYSNRQLRLICNCNACGSTIDRAMVTYIKHDFKSTICHVCYPPLVGKSKAEGEIFNFVKEFYPAAQTGNKSLIPPFEIDIFVPELNLGIEYNGLYWHSDAMDYPRDRHRIKYESCRKEGIKLIQIFEDEWLTKQEIVKAKLKNALGKDRFKIGARKTKVIELTPKTAKQFLNTYHIQGCGNNACHYYGLEIEGRLVATISFGKMRMILNKKHEEGAYEILRFATSENVQGGFSKLLKHFVNSVRPNKIISYADLRWSSIDDNVYIKNGFYLKSESRIGYGYTDLIRRYHRFGHRKPTGEPLSEPEWNRENGFYAIYDAGTARYELMTG